MMKMYTLVDSGYYPSKLYVCTHAEVSLPLLRSEKGDQAVSIKEISVSVDRCSRNNNLKKKLV